MDLFHAANIEYVNENFESAYELYSKAVTEIAAIPAESQAALYSSRAAVSLKAKHYLKALEDCNKAIALDVKQLILHFV